MFPTLSGLPPFAESIRHRVQPKDNSESQAVWVFALLIDKVVRELAMPESLLPSQYLSAMYGQQSGLSIEAQHWLGSLIPALRSGANLFQILLQFEKWILNQKLDAIEGEALQSLTKIIDLSGDQIGNGCTDSEQWRIAGLAAMGAARKRSVPDTAARLEQCWTLAAAATWANLVCAILTKELDVPCAFENAWQMTAAANPPKVSDQAKQLLTLVTEEKNLRSA